MNVFIDGNDQEIHVSHVYTGSHNVNDNSFQMFGAQKLQHEVTFLLEIGKLTVDDATKAAGISFTYETQLFNGLQLRRRYRR